MTASEKTSGSKLELVRELQTVGAWAAYRASLSVCQDLKAPAAARSQAASNILRAAGFFATRPDDSVPREPHEMTSEELNAAVAALRRAEPKAALEDTDSGVFG